MQIKQIKISNILGIDELEFSAGNYVEVSGANGTGKTSVLEAVKAALKGGNDATLIRNGSDKGEIVIEFDNGMLLQKNVASKSNLKLSAPDGSTIQKPQSQLDMLYDLLSVNPVEFLTAPKKERTRALLESLPISLSIDEINEVMKGYASNLPIKIEGHALEIMDSLQETIYGERRELNRTVKEKGNTITQLRESLVEVDFDTKTIDAKIKELEQKQEARSANRDKYKEKIEKELQEKIAELDRLKIEATEQARQNIELMNAKYYEAYLPAQEELTSLKEKIRMVGGIEKTRELISQYENERLEIENNSNELSEALSRLEAVKLNKLQNLPIKGLEIKEGEIYKDGVVFDRLNTAEQIKVAVEVAKLRAGELKLVCVDGLERFDQKTYDMFKKAMQKSGLQAIVTRVSNEDLTIKA